jgi:zinc resistance-associated protein
MGWGGGPDFCWGRGGGNTNLTDDQRKQLDIAHQKFYDGTAQLRRDLWAKRGELQILLNTSDPDLEQAKALQKEISDLAGKMAEARLEFRLEAKKIAPEGFYGGGYERGRGGYGRGMRDFGPGGMKGYGPGPGPGPRSGYGSGTCWR